MTPKLTVRAYIEPHQPTHARDAVLRNARTPTQARAAPDSIFMKRVINAAPKQLNLLARTGKKPVNHIHQQTGENIMLRNLGNNKTEITKAAILTISIIKPLR